MAYETRGFESGDSDRLDLFDLNRMPDDILLDLIADAGGDPKAALVKLVDRALKMDDELDITRLLLDKEREKNGNPPLVHDAVRRTAHLDAILTRKARVAELCPDEEPDDDYTKDDLDIMHDAGMEAFADFIEPMPSARVKRRRRSSRAVKA